MIALIGPQLLRELKSVNTWGNVMSARATLLHSSADSQPTVWKAEMVKTNINSLHPIIYLTEALKSVSVKHNIKEHFLHHITNKTKNTLICLSLTMR